MRNALASVLLFLLAASSAMARADVLTLANGDRVTGRVVSKTSKRLRVQTPYGVLVVPKEAVSRIEHDDGTLTAYMHLDDIADGLEVGDRVEAGAEGSPNRCIGIPARKAVLTASGSLSVMAVAM